MQIEISYDKNFTELMLYLKLKYGEKFFEIEGIDGQLDINKWSKDFFSTKLTADISIDESSNICTKDMIIYNAELSKPYFRLNAYYLIWKKLRQLYGSQEANKIIEMQLSGCIYVNDFHGVSQPYCYNFSTYDIALNGLTMVTKIKSIPPKYLYSFKSQLEQFVTIASNSALGATGLADLFIVIGWYIDKILETKSDAGFKFASIEDCWKYIRENIISFIYTINQPMRITQSPFTNISLFDLEFLKKLVPDYIFPDGKIPNIENIIKVQELFINIMNDEMERTPITFPITTACFSVDENNNIADKNFLDMIADKNRKFGFINIYCGHTSTLSSCCRLRSESNNEYFNSFGSGSTKIGSLGVVTINLPRLGNKYKNNKKEFFKSLDNIVESVAKINNSKRNIIKNRISKGVQPLYTLGFMDLNKQYSTVGLTGIAECINEFGLNILEKDGIDFVLEMMKTINETNDKMQKQYKAPHNCEQVPAESSSIKLAKKDKLLGYDAGVEFYSNQFIPLITEADMLDRIRIQGIFDKHFSGGSICHINIEEEIKDKEFMKDLITTCAQKGVIYFAVNYNIQQCENFHLSVGKNSICQICGKPITDNFTRVVGFLTNTKNWHKVRREQDYTKRQFYKNSGVKL